MVKMRCYAPHTPLSLCHSACALVDSSGSHVGLTVYNLADSAHFNIGDIIAIPDPHFKQVKLDTDKVPDVMLAAIFTACVKFSHQETFANHDKLILYIFLFRFTSAASDAQILVCCCSTERSYQQTDWRCLYWQ